MADILHRLEIDAKPEKVYSAITSKEGLKSWWTVDVEGESQKGSVLVFGFYNHTVVFRMHIDELVPNKVIRWTCIGDIAEWKGTRLLWELEQKNNTDNQMTTLSFSHTGWNSVEGDYRMCNTTWGHLMILLKDYAEKGIVAPYFV